MHRGKGPPLPLTSLRLLVPPLRLVSAAIWRTVQQRNVQDYGVLDEFVTLVTEMVPEVLNQRHRYLLSIGLRAQMILELCRSEQTANVKNIQPHLIRIKKLTTLWHTENGNAEIGSSEFNFLGLIQTLLQSSDERKHFFQDVFPVKFGPKYDASIKMLMTQFLSQLEKLFRVPYFEQASSMLRDTSSILEECMEYVCRPQELRKLLQYNKYLSQLDDDDNQSLPHGDCILSALSYPPFEKTAETKSLHTLPKTNYMDSFSKEFVFQSELTVNSVQMECCASTNIEELGERMGMQGNNGKQSLFSCNVTCDIEELNDSANIEPLHVDTATSSVGVQAGYKNEMDDSIEGHGKRIVQAEIETVTQQCGAGENFENAIDRERGVKKKTVEALQTQREIICPDSPNVIITPICSLITYKPNDKLLRFAPIVTLSRRPVRQNRGLKMKAYLGTAPKTVHPRPQNQDLSTAKTCPICHNTFSRASDMRRHQRTHTGERPYKCTKCNKLFQFPYDLKRHQVNVCRENVQRLGTLSAKKSEEKTFRDTNKCVVSGTLIACSSDINRQVKAHISPLRMHNCEEQSQFPMESKCDLMAQQQDAIELEEPECAGSKSLTPYPRKPYEGPQQCKVLLKTLSHPSLLKRSMKTQSEGCPYYCTMCNKGYNTMDSLWKHQTSCGVSSDRDQEDDKHECSKTAEKPPPEEGRVAQIEKSLRCNECGKKFNFLKTLRKHKLTHNPLYCEECNRLFPDNVKLETHNLKHQSRSCNMCDESFCGFKGLNQHYLDVHQFGGPFPCTSCERSYTDLKGLVKHERIHTGDLPFKCSKCPKSFNYPSALDLHDRTHTKEKPFLCWDCGKGCKSNAALKIHRLCCHSSSDEKRFTCDQCGKAYALKRSLTLHVEKQHTGVRYPCTYCGKLFLSASSLTRHDLTHTHERPFSCTECDKSFRSASELKIHKRYHTGERPFKCEHCGKGFVQSYYLTTHRRMHTGEKPFKCTTCDKYFRSTGVLKRHRIIHTGEKPYKCSICDMAFNRTELLKVHKRKSL